MGKIAKQIEECWVEEDKLDLLRHNKLQITGDDVVKIFNTFPIGSKFRVEAAHLVGPKCAGIKCSELVEILNQFLPKNWEWQVEALQEFANNIEDPNNQDEIVNAIQSQNGKEQAKQVLRMATRQAAKPTAKQEKTESSDKAIKKENFGRLGSIEKDAFFDF